MRFFRFGGVAGGMVRLYNVLVTSPTPRRGHLPYAEHVLFGALLAIAAAGEVCSAGCQFVSEGSPGTAEGDGEGSGASLPRWPWMAQDDGGSSGSEGAEGTAGEAEGAASSSGSSSDAGSTDQGSEGASSGSSGEPGGSDSTGEPASPYGPCDASCVAPWGCTSNGTWEACVLPCSTDDDCPEGGVCSGRQCQVPCPCEEGATCFGVACWWPA